MREQPKQRKNGTFYVILLGETETFVEINSIWASNRRNGKQHFFWRMRERRAAKETERNMKKRL